MEVVFFPVVKKILTKRIITKGFYNACLSALVICLITAGQASAKTLQVGGAPGRARIVFEMVRPEAPVITQEDQTLIVNFPDTIGEPALVSDTFIIKNLTFNGQVAHISMNKPFTYRTSLSEKPPHFVIDITASEDTHPGICPIDHVETSPYEDGITMKIFMNPDQWPEIRCNRNKRVYLLFRQQVDCSDLKRLLLHIPYIEFAGTIKMQEGMVLILSVTDENATCEIEPDEIHAKIILHIITTQQISRSKIYSIAQTAFDDGDIAAVIHTLEPYKQSLDSKESILLGKAYWRTSFPYHKENSVVDALKFISDGIQTMTPGPEREQVILEYVSMLLRTNMLSEAKSYIRFLKDSMSNEIALHAHIQEIDMMNKNGQFQDAFVGYKRLGNIFDMNAVPQGIKGYYLSVVGDTYLGLNSYARALQFYEKAMAADPSLFKYDPDLYSRIAQASYSLKDYAKAEKYTLLAINLGNPEDKADRLLEMGDCLYQLGQKNKAMSIFTEVENISPRSDSGIIAKLRTAKILLEQDLEKTGELTDKTFYEIMDIYEGLKSSQEYQEGPLGSLVKIRIAQTYARRNDWDNALEAYHKAWIDTRNDDPIHQYAQTEAEKTIMSRIRTLYQDKNYDMIYDLYSLYEDSFISDIKDSDSLFILADSINRLGYPDKARPLLITLSESDSQKRPQAIAALFTMDYNQANYTDALRWNSAYLKDYPQGTDAGLMRQTRGELLYYMNILEEAEVYLEPISNKNDQEALTALSMLTDIYRRLNNKEKETASLDKIIAFHDKMSSPVIEQALYSRAKEYMDNGENSRAQKLLTEMIEAYPQSSYKDWAVYHLARIAGFQNRQTEAKKLLSGVLQTSTDTVLINAASTYMKELDLRTSVDEFNKLKNRFGEN